MKFRPNIFFLVLLALLSTPHSKAQQVYPLSLDSIGPIAILNKPDSIETPKDTVVYLYTLFNSNGALHTGDTLKMCLDSLMQFPLSNYETNLYSTNSLLAPLVFMGKEMIPFHIPSFDSIAIKPQHENTVVNFDINKKESTEKIVTDLRADMRNEITRKYADKYYITLSELPSVNSFREQYINSKPISQIAVTGTIVRPEEGKIITQKPEKLYWRKKANALIQFSQNQISSNWYQGGNSSLALLSILSGQLIYDNFKNIQWENNLEWRSGFNSVEGDTLRRVATNDDLLRLNSKFGLKAFGNWYYTLSGEASTQLYDSYKGINSTVFKARLLTPVRVNVGVGMDYKYKKIFSAMIAPVSFKYIYANDTTNVNPNLFGIEKGKNHLKEIGSSMQAKLSFSPLINWQLDSRLTFFTNYKKVETDWEIVNNFNLNRFISARLSLNPRYDNTVIEKNGKRARIQFKQFLSIGLSFKLI
ncbi:MAG: DUF3078 domain-containing protein [Paludibacteraceae bacterium]